MIHLRENSMDTWEEGSLFSVWVECYVDEYGVHLIYCHLCHLSQMLLCFCQSNLSIGESGVLKLPTIMTLYLVVFVIWNWEYLYYVCMSKSIMSSLLVVPLTCVNWTLFLPTSLGLKSIWSDIRRATSVYFLVPFAWKIFFHSFTLWQYLSLIMRCVCQRQHTDESCLLIEC